MVKRTLRTLVREKLMYFTLLKTNKFSGTIPQSVRQKAIYNLLRESALPDYFNEIHCGASQNCGAMFSVFYRKKRITRVWARDV